MDRNHRLALPEACWVEIGCLSSKRCIDDVFPLSLYLILYSIEDILPTEDSDVVVWWCVGDEMLAAKRG